MRQKAPLTLLFCTLLFLSGCAAFNKQVVVYPIQDDDIYSCPAGATIHIPAGTVVKDEKGNVVEKYDKDKDVKVAKNGWVLSDFYMNEVMQAKLKK